MHVRAFAAAVAVVLAIYAPRTAADTVLLTSADTEGHALPCRTCPTHAGNGGLDRRAALVARERGANDVLLVDAGNFLIGPDSMISDGRVMAATYDALGYDAVNLSWRDLGLGQKTVTDMLAAAKFAAVSCNVVDEASEKPLVKPYAVRTAGGRRYALLGACEPPAGLDQLPGLRKRLAGVKVLAPAAALVEWLPKAKAESDAIILLYEGTPSGLARIRARFAADLAAIAVAGLRADHVATLDPGPPVIATEEHGKSIGRLVLHGAAGGPAEVALTEDITGDARVAALVAEFMKPAVAPAATIAGAKDGEPASPTATGATKGRIPPPADPPVATATEANGDPPAMTKQPALQPPVAPPPTVSPVAPPALPKRVAAKQPHEAKGLAGVGLTTEQVNAAIDRGADFLWDRVVTPRPGYRGRLGENGEYDLLVSLALVKANVHRRIPEFDAALRAYLPTIQPESVGVYGSGVLCMMLEAYGDAEFQPLLRRASRYLLESQSAEGSWEYYPKLAPDVLVDPNSRKALQVWGGRPTDGSPAEKWRRQTEPGKHAGGDNSVMQYALLGLHAASRSGVEVPREAWQRSLDLYRSRQNPNGGWGYVGSGSADSGSMTCAGIYGVALCRYHLGEKAPAEDEAVERGLGWMTAKFTVSENPGAGTWHYYYLYSLERAARTAAAEFVGPHEWYPRGARFLVDAQKQDGSWVEPGSYESRPEISTSFAVLFLTRGTALLTQARPSGGTGTLKTGIVEPAPPRVYLIFDCSGSMLVEVGGRQKFDVAREALAELMNGLPDRTQLALRVYGHRKNAREAGADEDTELIVPMGPIDRAAAAGTVRRLRARGKTPLARSIAAATKDLAGSTLDNRCAVVLITDGGEDTRPPGDPVGAAEDLARMPGITLHVVGFDIGREDWGRQLRAVAKAGGGRYWPAGDAAALRGELRAAILRTPERFTLSDADGRPVWRGSFGESKSLPEGRYVFATEFAGKRFNEPVWVNTSDTTAVLFDAGKIDVNEPAGAPPEREAPQAVVKSPPVKNSIDTPAKRSFCTECGAPLSAGAKFCTKCGTKVVAPATAR